MSGYALRFVAALDAARALLAGARPPCPPECGHAWGWNGVTVDGASVENCTRCGLLRPGENGTGEETGR